MSWLRMGLIGISAMLLCGCGWFGPKSRPQSRTLQSDSFYRRTVSEPDSGGAIVRSEVGTEPRVPTAQSTRAISPAVSQTITPAVPAPATAPTTPTAAGTHAASPSTAGNTTAQYMTLGAVVTEVSGTPIYADKVLAALTPMLSAEAKRRSLQDFQALARTEIVKQVRVMINDELEYAAAKKNLDGNEREFAERLTMDWRQRQITEAGGSLELARRKAAAEGVDFDEKVRQQNRMFLVQIYYQRKIFPKVQVTAEDMRRYYDQHRKTEFAEPDQALFRVIKITARNMGSSDAARTKAKELHERAARGEDFEKLAGDINHDPLLLKNAGRVTVGDGWIQRGSYAIAQVEDALWKLQPGEVTGVIEVGSDTFYIAKLENRKLGRVREFEEEDVQKQIEQTLRRAQLQIRREELQARLLKDSVIYPEIPVIAPVLEMAIQKYPEWAAQGS